MTEHYIEKAMGMIYDAKNGIVKPGLDMKDIKTWKRFRLSSRIGFGMGKYMIFFGTSGAGKTAFIDDAAVITPIIELFHVEPAKRHDLLYIYRSMERPPEEKMVKIISLLLYWKYNLILDKATLLQWPSKKRLLYDDDIEKIKSLEPYLEFISDRLILLGGARTSEEIYQYILTTVYKRGAFFKSDIDFVYCNGKKICDFEANIIGDVKIGNKKITKHLDRKGNKYIEIESGNKKVKISQQSQAYIPNNPNDLLICINDTINKIIPEKGQNALETLISHSRNMGELRDASAAGVIDISQMAKDDLKDIGKNLHLTQGHIKGAGDIPNNADIILSLINPLQYDVSEYSPNIEAEYDLNRCHGAFRLAQIIKNSDGMDVHKLPFAMLGEIGYFKELPPNGMKDYDYAELDTMFAHRYEKTIQSPPQELF